MTTEKVASAREPHRDDHVEVTINFTVPAWVVEGRHVPADAFVRWVREAAALYRHGRGEITLGTAAALAGIGYADFMDVLKSVKQNTFEVDWDDLERELADVRVSDPPQHSDA